MVAENTAAGENIGAPVAATDADDDTLTYGLSGQDAGSFDIDTATGQLMTKADLDYETKSSYMVTVTATDGEATASIMVTITVTDVNEVPEFAATAQRMVAENTAAGENIGAPVAATDADDPPQGVSQRLVGVRGRHGGADVLARCRALSNHDLRSGAGELWGFIHVSHRDCHIDAGRGFAVGGGYGDHVARDEVQLHGHRNRHRRRSHGQHHGNHHGD